MSFTEQELEVMRSAAGLVTAALSEQAGDPAVTNLDDLIWDSVHNCPLMASTLVGWLAAFLLQYGKLTGRGALDVWQGFLADAERRWGSV
jgi:hypothetical protein